MVRDLYINSWEIRGYKIMGIAPINRGAGATPSCDSLERRERLVQDGQLFGMNGPVKRLIDIFLSVGILIILAPLLLIVALLIRRDGGPALYRQDRIGRNGKRFSIVKFRSMRVDADEVLAEILASDSAIKQEWDEFQKLKDDPRITPIGKFLRASSIDELPQFLNVLWGDMSVVGQRPILPEQVSAYGSHIAEYERARPGITGLWQISGRNEVNFETRVFMGSQYINRWTLWQDIKIMAKTPSAILFKQDAF